MVRRGLIAVVLVTAACGGSEPRVSANTDGPLIKNPQGAGEGSCTDVPRVGHEVEFEHVSYGEEVAIEGVPNVGPKTCTMRKCPKSEPCCNRCDAAYVVTITGESRTATAIQLSGLAGCNGSECGVDCDPFGRKPEASYRFVGSLIDKVSPVGAKWIFEVKAFCPLP